MNGKGGSLAMINAILRLKISFLDIRFFDSQNILLVSSDHDNAEGDLLSYSLN